MTAPDRSIRPRVIVGGISRSRVCGVRDYAGVMAGQWRALGADVDMVWADLDPGAPRRAFRGSVRAWGADLARAVADAPGRPCVVVVNYSVFTFCEKAIPVHVGLLLRELAQVGARVVTIAHELYVPRDWRPFPVGLTVSEAQQWAFRRVLRRSGHVVVSETARAEAIAPWARRAGTGVSVVRVPSNMPEDLAGTRPVRPGVLAVVGFDSHDADPELVAAALASLGDWSVELVGHPGAVGPMAQRWSTALSSAGVRLEFTGELAPRDYAGQLAGAAAVLHPSTAGAGTRRTTLAACLASGRPVLTFEGRETWPPLRAIGATVAPTAEALAAALQRLRDPAFEAGAGRDALALSRAELSATAAARQVLAVCESVNGVAS